MKTANFKNRFLNRLYSILPGFILALFSILVLTGLFQSFIAYIFGVKDIQYSLGYLLFKPIINPLSNVSVIAFTFIYLSPLFFNVLLLEIGTFFLRKTLVGNIRFTLIIFTLLIAGYLIINVFFGAIISQLSPNSTNDWNQLLLHIDAVGTGKIIFMFTVILIFTIYLKQTAKRILEYIN